MMRFTFLLLFLPAGLFAQQYYDLTNAATGGSRLFHVDNHLILIQPVDFANQSQYWTTFDSLLNPVTTKKLVTPGVEHLVSQSYLECNRSVIRIDQFIIDDQLRISAFVFDLLGNITRGLHRASTCCQSHFIFHSHLQKMLYP